LKQLKRWTRSFKERSVKMNLIQGTGYAVIGLIIICWAAPLSVRYNAWTTGLRERHPNFNPPPTLEWRARNTKIMTVMFRVVGVFLFVLSIMYLLPLITKPHKNSKQTLGTTKLS
jgi:uncharacterized membrane protein YjgN (DUF898 family)